MSTESVSDSDAGAASSRTATVVSDNSESSSEEELGADASHSDLSFYHRFDNLREVRSSKSSSKKSHGSKKSKKKKKKKKKSGLSLVDLEAEESSDDGEDEDDDEEDEDEEEDGDDRRPTKRLRKHGERKHEKKKKKKKHESESDNDDDDDDDDDDEEDQTLNGFVVGDDVRASDYDSSTPMYAKLKKRELKQKQKKKEKELLRKKAEAEKSSSSSTTTHAKSNGIPDMSDDDMVVAMAVGKIPPSQATTTTTTTTAAMSIQSTLQRSLSSSLGEIKRQSSSTLSSSASPTSVSGAPLSAPSVFAGVKGLSPPVHQERSSPPSDSAQPNGKYLHRSSQMQMLPVNQQWAPPAAMTHKKLAKEAERRSVDTSAAAAAAAHITKSHKKPKKPEKADEEKPGDETKSESSDSDESDEEGEDEEEDEQGSGGDSCESDDSIESDNASDSASASESSEDTPKSKKKGGRAKNSGSPSPDTPITSSKSSSASSKKAKTKLGKMREKHANGGRASSAAKNNGQKAKPTKKKKRAQIRMTEEQFVFGTTFRYSGLDYVVTCRLHDAPLNPAKDMYQITECRPSHYMTCKELSTGTYKAFVVRNEYTPHLLSKTEGTKIERSAGSKKDKLARLKLAKEFDNLETRPAAIANVAGMRLENVRLIMHQDVYAEKIATATNNNRKKESKQLYSDNCKHIMDTFVCEFLQENPVTVHNLLRTESEKWDAILKVENLKERADMIFQKYTQTEIVTIVTFIILSSDRYRLMIPPLPESDAAAASASASTDASTAAVKTAEAMKTEEDPVKAEQPDDGENLF